MFRRHVGRLLIVAAGGGCLVVLIFVVLPMMEEAAPPATQDEIVAEVLGSDNRDDDGSDEEVGGADGVMPRSSSPVGVWNDGREGAVVFRAAESRIEEAAAPPQEVIPADVPVKRIHAEESRLPQILSERDVAEATAALEGGRSGLAAAVERDSAIESEADEAAAVEPSEVVPAASGEETAATLVALPADEPPMRASGTARETDIGGGRDGEEFVSVAPAADADAAVERLDAMVRALVRAMDWEREGTAIEDGPRSVERQGVRRGEFDLPVSPDSRARREVSHPSGGVPESAAPEAAQAGNAQLGLPPRTVRAGVIVPGTLRGVMGYRLPLVSRQDVPDQIVSGVLIPAHTTFVIVKQGAWELIDLTAEEVQALREAAARQEGETARSEAAEIEAPWTLWRALTGRRTPSSE